MLHNDQVVLDGKRIETWEDMERVYLERFKVHGSGHKTYFYSTEEGHASRLAYASTFLRRLVAPEDSVLDVGCGFGDLIPFLPACRYRGVDCVGQFVEEARRRHPDLAFDQANILDVTEPCDWSLVIGITGTQPMPEKVMAKAFGLARKGMIVDCIDARKDPGDDRNTFNLGASVEFFLDLGAKGVEVFPTRHYWAVFVAHKRSPWL